jgi:hypothetical protein
LPVDDDVDHAIRSAVNDLELVGCAEVDGHYAKVTQRGHQFARGGGLRTGWKGLFDNFVPLAEDRAVLDMVIELGIHEGDLFASAQRVELKDALQLVGQPCDQGTAVATSKRLEGIQCIRSPQITMAWCGVVWRGAVIRRCRHCHRAVGDRAARLARSPPRGLGDYER